MAPPGDRLRAHDRGPRPLPAQATSSIQGGLELGRGHVVGEGVERLDPPARVGRVGRPLAPPSAQVAEVPVGDPEPAKLVLQRLAVEVRDGGASRGTAARRPPARSPGPPSRPGTSPGRGSSARSSRPRWPRPCPLQSHRSLRAILPEADRPPQEGRNPTPIRCASGLSFFVQQMDRASPRIPVLTDPIVFDPNDLKFLVYADRIGSLTGVRKRVSRNEAKRLAPIVTAGIPERDGPGHR